MVLESQTNKTIQWKKRRPSNVSLHFNKFWSFASKHNCNRKKYGNIDYDLLIMSYKFAKSILTVVCNLHTVQLLQPLVFCLTLPQLHNTVSRNLLSILLSLSFTPVLHLFSTYSLGLFREKF